MPVDPDELLRTGIEKQHLPQLTARLVARTSGGSEYPVDLIAKRKDKTRFVMAWIDALDGTYGQLATPPLFFGWKKGHGHKMLKGTDFLGGRLGFRTQVLMCDCLPLVRDEYDITADGPATWGNEPCYMVEITPKTMPHSGPGRQRLYLNVLDDKHQRGLEVAVEQWNVFDAPFRTILYDEWLEVPGGLWLCGRRRFTEDDGRYTTTLTFERPSLIFTEPKDYLPFNPGHFDYGP